MTLKLTLVATPIRLLVLMSAWFHSLVISVMTREKLWAPMPALDPIC